MQKNPCSGLDVNPLHPSMTLQDYQDAVSLEDGLYPIEGDSDDYTPLDADAIGFVGTSLAAILTFSTTEHAVGKWNDKTLYSKVVEFGALPSTGNKTVNHGISNIDKVYFVFGLAVGSNGAWLSIPYTHPSNGNAQIQVQGTSTGIKLDVGTTDRSAFSGYFIYFYTKTS